MHIMLKLRDLHQEVQNQTVLTDNNKKKGTKENNSLEIVVQTESKYAANYYRP